MHVLSLCTMNADGSNSESLFLPSLIAKSGPLIATLIANWQSMERCRNAIFALGLWRAISIDCQSFGDFPKLISASNDLDGKTQFSASQSRLTPPDLNSMARRFHHSEFRTPHFRLSILPERQNADQTKVRGSGKVPKKSATRSQRFSRSNGQPA